ncbi:MAG: FAD:protein FMN transferase [Planctomycetota bacterium]|nr:FAD:protein FMN transferase [Planctomycetota bacterium]
MTSRRAGVFVVVIFAAWLGAQAEVQIYAGKTMGSTFAVKWHGGPDAGAIRAIVDDELAVADSTFSQWRDDSEIQRFNRHYSTAPFAASERLRAAVAIALQVAVATDGAFDPTVKPIVDLFRAQQADHPVRAAKPSEAALAAAREQVGYAKLKVIGETLKKDAPSLMIDLDGLVAGFVADRLGSRLSQVLVKGYLLEITGEVLAHGQKPDGAPWLGGIVDPLRSEPLHERALVTVPLRERALCTSGVYRNFIEQNGVITSHIFDPRTGKNATHGVVSVSVLANSCALADAFGTALLVLGPDAAWLAIARCAEPSMGAFFILADAGEVLLLRTVLWPEVFSLDGQPRALPVLSDAVRSARERELAVAIAAVATAPDSIEAIVWHARRLGYLGRFRESVEVLTAGLKRHPDEPHLLRHRGHRYLTLRQFAAAENDLALAAFLIAGKPDEVEPDGQPSKDRPPHSTLHYNIYYHLGLARFLLADFAGAAVAMVECLRGAKNDECRVAASHWLYCAQMRQGKRDAAAATVALITRDMQVVENLGYYQLCQLYRGDLRAADLLRPEGSKGATVAFGLAHYALLNGDPTAARDLFAKLTASTEGNAFGVLAAEAELFRLQ